MWKGINGNKFSFVLLLLFKFLPILLVKSTGHSRKEEEKEGTRERREERMGR